MALFPSEAECSAITNIAALKDECELSDKYRNAFQILTGNLGTKLRSMAMLQLEVIHAVVSTICVRKTEAEPLGHHIPPIEACRIGLMWRITRRLAWRAEGNEWSTFVDSDPLLEGNTSVFTELAVPAPATPKLVVASSGAAASTSLAINKVKVSHIMDQGDDSKVAIPGPDQIEKWEANYYKVKQANPWSTGRLRRPTAR